MHGIVLPPPARHASKVVVDIYILMCGIVIFGMPAVHCPDAESCYCNTFGMCNLTCTEDVCEGRYTVPPSLTLPEGWPEVGW